MKRIKAIRVILLGMLVSVSLIFSVTACASSKLPDKPIQLTIATGGTGGTYYPLGTAMANILTDYIEGVQATAVTSDGSVANSKSIGSKEVELALLQNDTAYFAQSGMHMFEQQPVENISGIATLYPEIVQIVTLKDGGITSLSDLRGKKVGIGAPGSGTAVHALNILEAAGFDETNVDIQYLDFKECAAALKSGVIHAACIVAGIPTSAVVDVASARDIAIVKVQNEIYNQLKDNCPFYVTISIPAETYAGVDEGVSTIAVQAMLATRADLPEDLIYEVTKAIFKHTDILIAAHERGRDVTLETALNGMPITLHPGAQRYFQGN
ncbi:TAXI family TRAP transporter solute-binding subunit [Chloroflexota bacterium]